MTDRSKEFQKAIEAQGYKVINLGTFRPVKRDVPEGHFLCWDCDKIKPNSENGDIDGVVQGACAECVRVMTGEGDD